MTVTRLIVALLALNLVACEDAGFERSEEITKLRVLAIQVDPPELGPGDTGDVQALVVDPEGRDVAYVWELCVVDDGPDAEYACALDEEGETLGVTLSSDATAQIPYDTIAGFTGGIAALCASLETIDLPEFATFPACDRGFPVTLRLTATVGDGQGANREVAVKRVLLLREDIETEQNTNPTLSGLLVDGAPVAFGGQAVVAPGEEPLALQAVVAEDQAEQYEDDDEEDGQNDEVLALRWFSTAGRIDRTQTFYARDGVPMVELQANEIDFTKGIAVNSGTDVQMWLVLRDDRGGVDFAQFSLAVPAP